MRKKDMKNTRLRNTGMRNTSMRNTGKINNNRNTIISKTKPIIDINQTEESILAMQEDDLEFNKIVLQNSQRRIKNKDNGKSNAKMLYMDQDD